VTRARRGALLATLLTSAVVAWAPLVRGPGYEHALALGLLLPSPVAVAFAHLERAGVGGASMLRAYAQIVVAALAGGVSPWLVYGACSPWRDVGYALATLALGVAAAAMWGLHAARIAGARSRMAVALAVAGPLGSLAASLAIFYATPTVHAFDAFAGYFSGPLYDTVLRLDGPFAAHRTAVAVWCVAAIAAARASKRSMSMLACASLATLAPLGPRMGTWLSRDALAERLPRTAERGGCILHASSDIEPAHVSRLARDADERRRDLEARLGVAFPGPIHVVVFRDGEEKGRLVGAADTLVAKPWRGEALIQGTSYPHPVLGHELAHVVAGALARGPLRVPGRFGGIVANPGLVEGVAVALAPSEEALTERAWASAMRARGLLPRLEELFGLGFLGGNASRGYTAAGAFVAHVVERHGVAALRRWYAGEDLPAAAGSTWPDLESAFHDWLDAETTTDAEQRIAAARFGAPGLAARRCAHVVDAAIERSLKCAREGRPEAALAALGEARHLDPSMGSVRLLEATLAEEARALEVLSDSEDAPAHVRDEALVRAGDRSWLTGQGEAAAARYEGALGRAVDEGRMRILEFKRAFARDPSTPEPVRALLTSAARVASSDADALILGDAIADWASPASSDVRRAFRAQQLFLRGGCEAALPVAATIGDAAPPSIARAMLRGRLVCACLRDDRDDVARVVARIDATNGWPRGLRRSLRELAGRCAGLQATGEEKKSLTAPNPRERQGVPPRE
jgi:hypothetical protein